MGGGTPALSFPFAAGAGNTTAMYSTWVVDKLAPLIQAGVDANSPYYNEAANIPDPDALMDDTNAKHSQGRMDATITDILAIDPETEYASFVAKAVAEAYTPGVFPSITDDVTNIHSAERGSVTSAVDAALAAASAAIADTPISNMVDAYEAKIKDEYLRGISRLASSLSDIDAVNSSAFVFGIALLNKELIRSVNDYTKSLELDAFKQYVNIYMSTFMQTFGGHLNGYLARNASKDTLILNGNREMSTLLANKISAEAAATNLQAELNRIRHVALTEKHRDGVALDAQDTLYDYQLYQYGANMLASSGGAAVLQPKMSPGQSMLGGASAGGGVGMMVGGPEGAAIGAGVGGIIGLFG